MRSEWASISPSDWPEPEPNQRRRGGHSARDLPCPCRRAGPGHRPRHLPRREFHLHQPLALRALDHPVRQHVPPPGGDGHHGLALGRPSGRALRPQTRLRGRSPGRPRVDGPSRHQPVLHEHPALRLRAVARGHRSPGRRFRPGGAGAQHLHRRLPSRSVSTKPCLRSTRCSAWGPLWPLSSSPSSSVWAPGGACPSCRACSWWAFSPRASVCRFARRAPRLPRRARR